MARKKTVWLCRDRQGEKMFVERPSFHGLHAIFMGKQADFEKVCRNRKRYRLITVFKVDFEDHIGGNKKVVYRHQRAGGDRLRVRR
jgi:hypothetical protein